MPAIQPAELWEESGRWSNFGPELLRLKDRHERDFCVGPTHEEVITDIARREVRSYRQLPVKPLPDPDKVPRRDPPALRGDARARIHHEGRLLVRPRRRGSRTVVPRDARRLLPHVRAARARLPRGRRRLRRDRRQPVAGVPRHRRLRRGRHRILRRRLRGERRDGPLSAASGSGASRAGRNPPHRRYRRGSIPSRIWPGGSASPRNAASRRCSSKARTAASPPSCCAATTS